MRKRTVVAGVVLLLVTGIVTWFIPLTPARSDIERRAREAARSGWVGDAVPAPRVRIASSSATTPHAEFGPLPPVDLPLREIYPDLVRRAQAGDFRASCRLSHELSRCAFLSSYVGHAMVNLEKLAKRDDERARRAERYTRDKIARDQGVCAGFSTSEALPAWQYLFEAAMAGHLPSMARFAIVPPLHPLDIGSAPLAWQVYRHYAPGFLREAADAGERSAVSMMATTAAGDLLPLPEVRLAGVMLAPQNYFQAVRYAQASKHLGMAGPKTFSAAILANAVERLSPSEYGKAQAEGDALAATWGPERLAPQVSRIPGQGLPVGPLDCLE